MSDRLVKVNSVILKDVANYALKQAQGGDFIITVNYALATPDLRFVRIGISTFPNENKHINMVIKVLRQNKSRLQLKLARDHKLKNIPKIAFEPAVDDQAMNKVDELLEKITHE
jgi:ribosome-binding factor A